MRIGIDFDNTIADYDAVFHQAAAEMDLLDEGFSGGKAAVRDALRARSGGELDWQRLQGQVYGRYMPLARPMPGILGFLGMCLERNVKVLVISHKTKYGHHDPARIDLRQASMNWLAANGFFEVNRSPLRPEDITFEPTRAGKVARIADAGVDHFIDDLQEVFDMPHFPASVACHLFETKANNWNAISEAIFGA